MEQSTNQHHGGKDPRHAYYESGFAKQQQTPPGSTEAMDPRPDHGEESYRGSGMLTGRRALITGGDSGIGRAVAIAFAREGADVAISYLPDEQRDAEDTGRLIEEAGRTALLLPGDLQDEAFCSSIVTQTVERLGGLDTLVLNAGYQRNRDGIDTVPTADFERVMRTNVFAPVFMVREALKHLQPGASIIVTASIQGFNPSPSIFDYAMTKFALVGFTRVMAEDLGPKGIRVNAVAPGPIWTPLIPSTGWDEKLESFGQDTPLGRAGQPAELAGAYVYLASDHASYTSGAILPVTGGKPL
ncbi:SDR family oxidoreductase [Ruicaihuangia caeni]|uniref:SDR family oxidoreductase n=1 Tax=Ruicaihuangia caeni TaxID=3042517 RepID=UPI00338D4DF5